VSGRIIAFTLVAFSMPCLHQPLEGEIHCLGFIIPPAPVAVLTDAEGVLERLIYTIVDLKDAYILHG
jgi:hypothetical protein